MRLTPTARFFDGKASARRSVLLELEETAVVGRGVDGQILLRWPYGRLQQVAAPAGMLRFGCRGTKVAARLEIRDPGIAAVISSRLSAPRRPQGLAAVLMFASVGVLGQAAVIDRVLPLPRLKLEGGRQAGGRENPGGIKRPPRDLLTGQVGLPPTAVGFGFAVVESAGPLRVAAAGARRYGFSLSGDPAPARHDHAGISLSPGGNLFSQRLQGPAKVEPSAPDGTKTRRLPIPKDLA